IYAAGKKMQTHHATAATEDSKFEAWKNHFVLDEKQQSAFERNLANALQQLEHHLHYLNAQKPTASNQRRISITEQALTALRQLPKNMTGTNTNEDNLRQVYRTITQLKESVQL